MDKLILEPLVNKFESKSTIRRSCRVIRLNSGTVVDEKIIWFEFEAEYSHVQESDCDGYLICFLLEAMQESRNIEVRGDVSSELLRNLEEMQEVWHCWLPDRMKKVTIDASNIIAPKTHIGIPLEYSAVLAYSGGVDATFSVWQHSQALNRYSTVPIKFAVIVQGFDIALHRQVEFENSFKSAQSVLQTLDIPLVKIRTNFKEISNVSWEFAFGSALVGTLSNFRGPINSCIIGSSEPYDGLVFPWGSTPLTDPLLSSDQMRVFHHGAGYSRTNKVKLLSEWKVGRDNLRVCWESALKDRNCGSCEKCQRTILNFLVNGLEVPECFPNKELNLSSLTIRSGAVLSEWKALYRDAKAANIDQPWVKDLKKLINKRSLLDVVFPKGSEIRRRLKAIHKP